MGAFRTPRFLVVVAVLALLAAVLTTVQPARGVREARFAAVGDFGARTSTRAVLDAIAARNPTAALALGDLAYDDVASEQAWCAFVKQSVGEGFPFQLISGNHESLDVADGAINNYSACLPNQVPGVAGTYGREYVMDFPKGDPLVRVISVSPQLTFEDGKWTYTAGDAHHQWLSAAIDAGRAAGAKWTIVSAHLPCWSVGSYNCSTTDFTRLMLSKKVDLVLHGHEHGYMRTHQLAAGVGGCATVPIGSFDADCVRDSDAAFTAGQGTVFATVGTGGIPLRDINPADSEAGYFAASSGLNASPSYGFLDISVGEESLSASFVPVAGGTFGDAFTITRGAAGNQPPVAAFTPGTAGLTVNVDSAASSDPDGSIAARSWSFGDGSAPVTGTTASHTYAAAGTYTVTLTVTDDAGATNSVAQQVTVSTGPAAPLASDAFARSVSGGWGSADTGGPYTLAGAAANYSVDGSAGVLSIAPGTSRRALLRGVSTASSDLRVTIAAGGPVTGGGVFVSAMPRVMADTSAYRAKVTLSASGVARVAVTRVTAAGAETVLASAATTVTGVTAGRRLLVRVEAVGASPTTVRARIWLEGQSEPTVWHATATDSTAALQGPGGPGVFGYLSGTATGVLPLRIDDLRLDAP